MGLAVRGILNPRSVHMKVNTLNYQNILVTGCAGFIASKTAQLLLDAGKTVIGVDNLNDYYDVSIKEHRLGILRKYPNFIFRKLDIESREEVHSVFESFPSVECVLNLAARAGVRYSMEDPHVYMQTNAVGTLNLLEEIRARQIEKFVLASTSSLYAGQQMPFVESLPVNAPISPYAASKKAAEVMAYTYHHLYGVDVSVVRYFTVYGPAGRPDMSPFRFVKWIAEGTPLTIYGDGTQSRDFTYVDDIASGTIAATKKVGYEIVNLGGGNSPISLIEMIRSIEKFLGKKAELDHKPFHKADMKTTWADISKAKKLLGWQPAVSTDEGFERTVDWYLENKEWIRNVNV